MRSKYIIVISIAVLMVMIAGSSATTLINLSVEVVGKSVRISWEMVNQSDVRHFNVQKREINEEKFSNVNNSPIPLNPEKVYKFYDLSVPNIDESIILYRIAIVHDNGSVSYSETVQLGKISGVRRTWGSIKSMFR